jgi:hypothetical protein
MNIFMPVRLCLVATKRGIIGIVVEMSSRFLFFFLSSLAQAANSLDIDERVSPVEDQN